MKLYVDTGKQKWEVNEKAAKKIIASPHSNAKIVDEKGKEVVFSKKQDVEIDEPATDKETGEEKKTIKRGRKPKNQ